MGPLHVVLHSTPGAFLEAAAPLLGPGEAEYNVMVAHAHSLLAPGTRGTAVALATVHADGGVPLAAALTVPGRGLVTTRAPLEAMRVLAESLHGQGLVLEGLEAPVEEAQAFAATWTARTGQAWHPFLHYALYEAHRVRAPAHPGALRRAGRSDVELLATWRCAFGAEAGIGGSPEECRQQVEALTSAGRLFVWEDGGVRAMAAWVSPTPRSARLVLVYTPPEARGRGHAQALSAAVTQELLTAGKARVVLYADVGNPASNRVYQAIGYERRYDLVHLRPASPE